MTPGSVDNARVVAAANAFQPNILFVGMGMPRQEAWIADNIAELPCAVILSVGAAFDYGCSPATVSSPGACWARRWPTCAPRVHGTPLSRHRFVGPPG